MAIVADTILQLAREGITKETNLRVFNKKLEIVAVNLLNSGRRFKDPDPGAYQGDTIPTPILTYGSKYQKMLV